MKRGHFITFEGGDGVGKSTQIQRLAARLRGARIPCQLTREPGGTPFAERVRAFILEGSLPPHPALAEAFLFAAARHDHVEGLIRPALDAGRWVLCDRFSDSTRAYQGAAGGVDMAVLQQLEVLTHGDCTPNLTLVMDLDPEAGRARIAGREGASAGIGDDPFERRNLEFQHRLRTAFLDIAAREPKRCQLIDAGRSPEDVEQDIWAAVEQRLRPEAV